MTDQDIVLNSFYKRTFFNSWLAGTQDNYHSLELITTDRCSLACKYCYFNKFGKELFTPESRNEDNIFEGFKKIIEWLTRNGYHPDIHFFSGEFFQQPINIKILDYFLDNLPPGIDFISIPVGGTFLLYNSGDVLIDYQKRFREKGVRLSFSLSVDGKYMDENRPLRNKNLVRDDAYYDKVFKFAKATSSGFHPMVYAEGIQNWKKNFTWFQEKFKEFDIPWNNMYLLEVRNNNWTQQQFIDYAEFIEFLIFWTWDFVGKDKAKFIKTMLKSKSNFNILGNCFTTTGRGIGCGIQGNVHVRLGDLSIFPCHRLMKPFFKIGEFNVEDGKITDVKAHNVELGVLIKSFDKRSLPVCETCLIKNLCAGQCLGSCHETHGDPFAPIPVVCQLFHIKVSTFVSALKKINVYHEIIGLLGHDKYNGFINLEEELCLRKK